MIFIVGEIACWWNWWSCLAAIAAIISKANLYILFFEGAAIAALEEGEAGPKKGLQEGFGWEGRSCCNVEAF
jgi:hypothetical protein